jgi:DnaK suppressor protein
MPPAKRVSRTAKKSTRSTAAGRSTARRATKSASKAAATKRSVAGRPRGGKAAVTKRSGAAKSTRTAKAAKSTKAAKSAKAGKSTRAVRGTKAAPAKQRAAKAKVAKKATKAPPARRAAKAAAGRGAVRPKAAGAKRPPVKKAPPPRPLDPKVLAEQRELLLAERATYAEQAEDLKAEADSLVEEMEPGDVQFDEESGEGGTVTVDRERDLALSAQALAAVEEIDHALAKIEKGTYGFCENCHAQIPRARLRALPYARLCVACKSGGLSRR